MQPGPVSQGLCSWPCAPLQGQEECDRQLEKKLQEEKHVADKQKWAKEVEDLKQSQKDWNARSEHAVNMNKMCEDDIKQVLGI